MNKTIKIFLSALIVALSLTVTINPVLAATTSTPLTEQVQSSPNLSQQDIQDKVDDTKSQLEDNVEDTLVSEAQEAMQRVVGVPPIVATASRSSSRNSKGDRSHRIWRQTQGN